MNLPFFKDKQEKQEYYLALILTEDKAESIILEAALGKIKIIGSHAESFSNSIEEISQDEFTDIIDKSISKAEEILPPNIETHKTVFGVKEAWIEEETKKIKKEYLAKLKKMCDSLDLSPVGFMVTSEAVIHLLQDEEEAPLSAVVADIQKNHVTLKLLRGGKTIETINGPLQESLPATVDLLLRHFTVPVLPARIILLHTKGDEVSQQFITHQWSKGLPFLHLPQITLLPSGFDARAVTYGAATQMGFEVLETGEKETPQHITINDIKEETDGDVTITEIVEETQKVNDAQEEPERDKDTDNLPTIQHNKEPGFGFILNQDVPETESPAHQVHIKKPSYHNNISQIEPDELEMNIADADGEVKSSPLSHLISLFHKLPLFRFKLPTFVNLQGNNGLLKIIIPAVILLLIIGGIIFFYLFQVKVKVVLTAQPKMVDKMENITFSTSSPSDYSKKIIAAKTIPVTVDGELSKDTTGKKDIGDKAKGNVTIINKDFSKKQLDSGTVITSNNNFDFSLDKDITVASASGDDSGIKFGTIDVPVTAKAIGTDSNLPSGTKFTVGGSSTLTAKNSSAFSGGTKKTVTAVSKEDFAKLRSDLPKSLEDKGKAELAKKTTGGIALLPTLFNPTLKNESFDKKIGDEAKKVKLSAKVIFDGISYQNDELESFIKSILTNKSSDDISFAQNSIQKNIKEIKQKNDKEVTAQVTITVGVLPKINTDDVAKRLDGQSLANAKETLSNLPQISDSKILFSPSIPLLPNIFPMLPKNITVVMKNQ
jgi:hypothetical protein